MIVRDYKPSKRVSRKKGVYALVVLCALASGIGSFAAINRTLGSALPSAAREESTSAFTVDWNAYGNSEVTHAREQANVEATGVPDIRETENMSEETAAEVTAAAETEQSAPSNEPFKGSFVLPMGNSILKDYSNGEMVYSETTGDWRVHNGVDFVGEQGDYVAAIHDGTVSAVRDDPMWGTVIEIDHGAGLRAVYCGLMSGSTPSAGFEVRQNDVIGKLDTIPIESAQGAHLHLEIFVNGQSADPLSAMNLG